MRWALGLEYDGSHYHGWQKQQDATLPTLQVQLEHALSKIANHPVEAVCAGRTDRGVHAWGQVIHFDTVADRTPATWVAGVNHCLPADMRITWAIPVDSEFHARYSALSRRYCYQLYCHPIRPALYRQYWTWINFELDIALMQLAAQDLVGEHDFSAFRGADCQARSPIRRVDWLTISQTDHIIKIDIQANAFLHHMVRNIVGVLLEIGKKRREPDWAKAVLLGRDRKLGGITAPPQGLYLMGVEYPKPFPTL
ncbi:MAG: tRNA pseudouridine(38-40) synthase TruA [Gammaproteobacteria bacterium]